MHDLYDNLEQLCETVAEEINASNEKIKSSGGKLTSGDVEYLDKLTHMLKSIKTTKAMMDAEDDYSFDVNGSSYRNGGRRGRGMSRDNMNMSTRRDSRGRYARENRMPYYGSYDDDMISELHELMNEAPNDHVRQKFQQFISEIEMMK